MGHPFDTVKVRMQTDKIGGRASPLRVALDVVRGGGALALYRGASATALLALPRFAVIFHANAVGRRAYRDTTGKRETR